MSMSHFFHHDVLTAQRVEEIARSMLGRTRMAGRV